MKLSRRQLRKMILKEMSDFSAGIDRNADDIFDQIAVYADEQGYIISYYVDNGMYIQDRDFDDMKVFVEMDNYNDIYISTIVKDRDGYPMKDETYTDDKNNFAVDGFEGDLHGAVNSIAYGVVMTAQELLNAHRAKQQYLQT